MRRLYGTIQDFINIKDRCIFCYQPLSVFLTNKMSNGQSSFPDIHAPLKDKQFQFPLKYDGERLRFDVHAILDIENHRFGFYHDSRIVGSSPVISVFTGLHPCIELICQNKSCDMNYHLESDSLRSNEYDIIRPISLTLEAFLIDNWWVGNPYTTTYNEDYNEETWIMKQNSFAPAIHCPRLNFEAYPKDKLISRIRTAVNFS
jgi:hypothetical protein